MEESEARVSSEDADNTSDEDASEPEVELMVTTRVKRVTAGNRYSNVVAQEEVAAEDEQDDVALLFAEGDEEDEEYNSDEGADDADMSSSDDDDQGPTAGAEDLEGEKDIEKEAKAERAKKRKADMAMTSLAGLRKKPRIDPTSLRRAAVPKLTKRKERVSWLPEQSGTSGRTSLRAQTIAHREETHAKLKVNEEQRLKAKAIREKRVKQREAEAPKELTQADRLAEAERIERKNAKSLNRWETMEKKRAEEQAAKLAALKDRKLEGAVLTWYSSSHIYHGQKDERDTHTEAAPEGKKRGRKTKAFHEQMAAARLADATPLDTTGIIAVQPASASTETNTMLPVTTPTSATMAEEITSRKVSTEPQQSDHTLLTGIHEYASMESDAPKPNTVAVDNEAPAKDGSARSADKTMPSDEISRPILVSEADLTINNRQDIPMTEARDAVGDQKSTAISGQDAPETEPPAISIVTTMESENNVEDPTQRDAEMIDSGLPDSNKPTLIPGIIASGPSSDYAPSPVLSAPLVEVISTRNMVILERFEDLTGQGRHNFGMFYNNRKTAKPTKHTPELCLITGLPARYRDPATGMGYANTLAYKKLQDLKKHQFTWSSMLGCYVGRSTFVARGVPEGFLGP